MMVFVIVLSLLLRLRLDRTYGAPQRVSYSIGHSWMGRLLT